jgi:hypothetical protein
MSIKNVLSIAAVIIVVMIVWKFVKVAFNYALIAGVIYLLYVFFIAPNTSSKKE